MQHHRVRLIGMVGMLIVLGVLIVRTRDPQMWQWLVAQPAPQPVPAAPPAVAAEARPVEPVEGPTDLDPEEHEAAEEVFQAVSDGTLEIQPEEMPSYHRLLDWSEHQSAATMLQRADAQVLYTQFVQRPQEYRGRLVTLDLEIRRILSYEDQGRTLYEVWGWTRETQGWPYVAVVLDLPPGTPIGPDVETRARVVGYFFKLQGYQEAGAKPHAAPLKAPLILGRLVPLPAGAMPVAATTALTASNWLVVVLVTALVGVLGLVLTITGPILRLRRQERQRATAAASAGSSTPAWPLEVPDEENWETAADDEYPRVS